MRLDPAVSSHFEFGTFVLRNRSTNIRGVRFALFLGVFFFLGGLCSEAVIETEHFGAR